MTLTRHNYEEFFLLYVDNELEPEDRVLVESFARVNPDLGAELQQLQRAVLRPDEEILAFDKNLLYRSEQTQRRPVLYMWRKELLAAASVLLLGGAFWLFRLSRTQPPATIETAVVKQAPGHPSPTPTPGTAAAPVTNDQAASGNTPSVEKKNPRESESNRGDNALAVNQPMAPAGNDQNNAPAEPARGVAELTPHLGQQAVDMPSGFSPATASSIPSGAGTVTVSGTEENKSTIVTSAGAVSYHTLEGADQKSDDNKILFVRTDQVMGGDVKGFFRRASRTLRHSTSNEENIHPDPVTEPR